MQEGVTKIPIRKAPAPGSELQTKIVGAKVGGKGGRRNVDPQPPTHPRPDAEGEESIGEGFEMVKRRREQKWGEEGKKNVANQAISASQVAKNTMREGGVRKEDFLTRVDGKVRRKKKRGSGGPRTKPSRPRP